MNADTPVLEEQPPGLSRVEGPSFSTTHKLLASGLLLALAGASLQLFRQGAWAEVDNSTRLLIGMLTLLILSGYWGILNSRTTLDGERIRQSWLWPKEVALAELTQVKLIHVPGMSWLIAPRLVVRTGGVRVTTFHVADPQLLEACRRLAYG